MNVRIFSSNKSWVDIGLNLYITKSLKIHESLTKCLIIKTVPFLVVYLKNSENLLSKKGIVFNAKTIS